MLISTRHKFVFLANRKCASSSLVHSLQPYSDVVMDADHRLRHTSFSEYQRHIKPFLTEKIGDEVDEYSIFCLFREPTDWLYSWYRFRTRPEIAPDVAPDHWEYTGDMSWAAFLDEALKLKPALFANFGGRQYEFIEGLDGSSEGLTLFRYDQMDRFLDRMKQQVEQDFDLVEWNVSPSLDGGPTPDDIARCRVELAADYRVYDGITEDGPSQLTQSLERNFFSDIKRKIFSRK